MNDHEYDPECQCGDCYWETIDRNAMKADYMLEQMKEDKLLESKNEHP